MKLFIQKMEIDNFKGIQHLKINFSNNTSIYARNGLGKTSIADAFYWVLFGKDSAGHTAGNDNFRVKPLDVYGNEIHNLETDVVLTCTLDDVPFVLRRMQAEKWTKKRGHAESVYEGNVSTYWINGVETGAEDFKSRIMSIATEDTFDMIAMMSKFNSVDWKKRREILIGMSGIDADSELMSLPKYADLSEACKTLGVNVGDIKKVLESQKKGLKRDLEAVPIRIDEISKSVVNVSDEEIKEAEYMVKDRGETIAKLDQLLAAERAGVGGNDNLLRLNSVNRQMLDMQSASMSERALERDRIIKEIRMREDSSISYSRRISEIKADLERLEKRRTEAVEERSQLRAEYSKVFAETFESETIDVCPTCGQRLPDEQIIKAHEAAMVAWIADKKRRLEIIKAHGSDAAQRVAEIGSSIDALNEESERINANDNENGAVLSELRQAQQEIERKPLGYLDDPAYQALAREAEELKSGSGNNTEKIRNLEDEKKIAVEAYDKAKAVLAKRDQFNAAQDRIAELQKEHRKLGDQIANVEKLIMLTEGFIAERCKLLEESINNLFPTISWKLFDTQINGGIVDTCVCMIPCHGACVPYASANTASKLHADIEIINVFSKFYDVQVPLFFDNRERVNFIPHTEGQIITLSVSEDEQIRVENN